MILITNSVKIKAKWANRSKQMTVKFKIQNGIHLVTTKWIPQILIDGNFYKPTKLNWKIKENFTSTAVT